MSYRDAEDYSEHCDAIRKGLRGDVMRIMRSNCQEAPRYIRMDALNEEWAQHNHSQSLKRLNERGGLSPCEAVAIIQRRDWHPMDLVAAAAILRSCEVTASQHSVSDA